MSVEAMNEKVLTGIERVELTVDKGGAGEKTYRISTASEAKVNPNVSEGREEELRHGNKILATDKTEDLVKGYDIDFSTVNLPAEVLALVDGGVLVKDENQKVIGYDAPAVGAVVTRTKFEMTIYSREPDTSGDTIGYVAMTIPNCKGKPVGFEFAEGGFFAPQFQVESRPASGQSPSSVRNLTELPA